MPILCVGENYKDRENNKSNDVIKEQLSKSLNKISKNFKEKIKVDKK